MCQHVVCSFEAGQAEAQQLRQQVELVCAVVYHVQELLCWCGHGWEARHIRPGSACNMLAAAGVASQAVCQKPAQQKPVCSGWYKCWLLALSLHELRVGSVHTHLDRV